MKTESGRSLVEIIGVMAVGAVMTAGAIAAYGTIRKNQTRTIAAAQLEQVASDVKLLLEMRGSYQGVSVDYLIKSGALKNGDAPIGGAWSVTASSDGKSFSINLSDISRGECEYFTTAVTKWASAILVNGFETEPESHCFSSDTNQISFIVE